MRRYAYGWITLIFFAVSMVGHWVFGWFAYVDEARSHAEAPQMTAYLVEMGRDTFENWQSEFLQLLWQVVGLAYFLYVGSPSSKENDDRTEAKLDALLELLCGDKGKEVVKRIDETHDRYAGHADPHHQPPYGPLESDLREREP